MLCGKWGSDWRDATDEEIRHRLDKQTANHGIMIYTDAARSDTGNTSIGIVLFFPHLFPHRGHSIRMGYANLFTHSVEEAEAVAIIRALALLRTSGHKLTMYLH